MPSIAFQYTNIYKTLYLRFYYGLKRSKRGEVRE